MSLLSARFSLHDVDDVEALAWKVIGADRRLHLAQHQCDELCTYLVSEIWRLSLRYEPGRGNVTFASFAYRTASLRVTDWLRLEFGRSRWQWADSSYERERPELVSLDADDPEHGGVGAPLSAGSVDDGAPRLADELRGLEARARRPGGRNDYLDCPPPRRAA